jgi:hypothetical protein
LRWVPIPGRCPLSSVVGHSAIEGELTLTAIKRPLALAPEHPGKVSCSGTAAIGRRTTAAAAGDRFLVHRSGEADPLLHLLDTGKFPQCSVRSQSRPVELLTLCMGKPTSDQAAGIGMNGRSVGYSDHGKRQIGRAA